MKEDEFRFMNQLLTFYLSNEKVQVLYVISKLINIENVFSKKGFSMTEIFNKSILKYSFFVKNQV